MTKINTIALAERILSQGGYTWSPLRSAPRSGYMVGVLGTETRVRVSDFTHLVLDAFMQKWEIHPNSTGNAFYGAWVEDGYVYLDVSKRYTDALRAVDESRMHAQKAFYDIANKVSIYL